MSVPSSHRRNSATVIFLIASSAIHSLPTVFGPPPPIFTSISFYRLTVMRIGMRTYRCVIGTTKSAEPHVLPLSIGQKQELRVPPVSKSAEIPPHLQCLDPPQCR